jgi:hypothetical protein
MLKVDLQIAKKIDTSKKIPQKIFLISSLLMAFKLQTWTSGKRNNGIHKYLSIGFIQRGK